MKPTKILMLGSSHLAYRVKRLAEKKGYSVGHVNVPANFHRQGGQIFDDIQELFTDVNFREIAMVYLLDDRDDYNLGLAIALISVDADVPITVSLFNENIAPHLKATHPNIHIINPAKIAAPKFVELLSDPVNRFLKYELPPLKEFTSLQPSDPLLKFLTSAFLLVIMITLGYLIVIKHIPVLDALYAIVATVAGSTDVFGAWAPSKLVEIFLIASSMFFVWIIFTLTADRIIKARSEYSLGRKRYNYRDHVIVCGLGRFGYFIVEELVKRGEQVVVIESNENSANIEYIRSLGAEVYVGNARLVRVLQEVGVAKAKAVMSVTGDDYVNLEVGLNARSCNPSLRLILRIFDDAMAQAIREHLDIHLAYSMSALADDAFIATIDTIETVPIADGNQVVN